jgi:hypothetical protein
MDPSLLREPLWQALLNFLLDYLRWSRQTPRSLSEREERLQSLSEKLCGVLLQGDAEADDVALRPGPCACGGRFQSKGRRDRTLVTTLGTVRFSRRYYECESCGAHGHPVDPAWGVTRDSLSARAKTVVVDLASALPFREARVWLERLGRMSISLATVWRVTQEAGAERVAEWTAHQKTMRSPKGAAAFLARLREPGEGGRWAIGMDGLMLRIERQWREVKVAVIAPVTSDGHWQRGQITYVASTAEAEEFRHQVVWQAVTRGITRQSTVALISDGAAWILALATRHFPQAVVIRDWYHVAEYLWKAAFALHGVNCEAVKTTEAEQQVDRWLARLKTSKVRVIRRHLRGLRKRIRGTKAIEAFRTTEGYLEQHTQAMDYAAYRAAHWPIGSGPVEATCKMVQVRMKRSGANWSRAGAQNMLFLRAEYCSRLATSFYPQS